MILLNYLITYHQYS